MRWLEKYFEEVNQRSLVVYKQAFPEADDQLTLELVKHGRSTFPTDVVTQALNKFTHAILFDPTTFDEQFKAVFIGKPIKFRVLMPYIEEGEKEKALKILDIVEGVDDHRKHAVFPEVKCAGIKHVHAEQILVKYLFDIRNARGEFSEERKLPIGITKLTCGVCSKNLAELHVRTRGQHGNIDVNTSSLLINEVISSGSTTPRRASPTAPAASPPGSAQKRREAHVERYHSSTIKAKKRLSFGSGTVTAEMVEESFEETRTVTWDGSYESTETKSVTSTKVVKTFSSSSSSESSESPKKAKRLGQPHQFFRQSRDESSSDEGFQTADEMPDDEMPDNKEKDTSKKPSRSDSQGSCSIQ